MRILFLGILQDSLPLVPLLLGIVWTFRYQTSPDFSLAGSFSLGSAFVAVALEAGLHPLLSLGIGLAAGLVVGLATGILCNFMKVDALLAGVLVLFMSYSWSLAVTQGTIRVPSEANSIERLQASTGAIGITTLFFILVLVLLLVNHWILESEWGCSFRALESKDSGRTFLVSIGISPTRLSCTGFAIAGGLAALSGIVVALRDGQATSSLGTETFIDAVPAYLLGSLLFERRVYFSQTKSRVISRLAKLFRFASPSIAASLGVCVFFTFVNASLFWVHYSWLPKLALGAGIAGMLGLPSLISDRRLRAREQSQTRVTGTLGDLEASGLSVSYPTLGGSVSVIENGFFQLSSGSVNQIEGTNGSGKTSLLKALCGRIGCEGEFVVPIAPSQQTTKSRRSLLLYVPQDPSEDLVECLTLAEHVSLCSLRGKPSPVRRWKSAVGKCLAELPLDNATKLGSALPGAFSGGERRRILLGLLRVRGEALPRVLCLDEPFSCLDQGGTEYCIDLIQELASKDHIIILTDHGSTLKPAPRSVLTWGSVRKEGLGREQTNCDTGVQVGLPPQGGVTSL